MKLTYWIYLALLIGNLPAADAAEYTVTDIGTLSGSPGTSWPNGINNRGEVVGYSITSAGTNHAFIWDATEGIRDLGDLFGGADNSGARDINESGQIVGYGSAATGLRAVLWDSGVIQDLGDLAGGIDSSDAYGINKSGMITGSSYTSDGARSFLWDAISGMQELPILPGMTGANAFAINNSNEIVGMATDTVTLTAFRWTATTGMQDIGDLATGEHVSYAYDVNNKGTIIGRGNITEGDRAIFWRPTSGLIDLGIQVGGINSYAYAVNNFHHVVGDTTSALGHRAALWKDPNSAAQDLNDLIDPVTGWILIAAYDINDVGQIVGIGFNPNFDFTGFVLSPTPTLTAFWPANASQGLSIFLFGSGFIPDQTQVTVDGVLSPGVQWLSPNLVLALRPFGITSGEVSLTTPYGSVTATEQFGAPQIGLNVSGIWPEQGIAGDFIFVFGSGFSGGTTQVSINGVNIPLVQIVNDSLLTFIAPGELTSGPVTVTTASESDTSTESFVVIP